MAFDNFVSRFLCVIIVSSLSSFLTSECCWLNLRKVCFLKRKDKTITTNHKKQPKDQQHGLNADGNSIIAQNAFTFETFARIQPVTGHESVLHSPIYIRRWSAATAAVFVGD